MTLASGSRLGPYEILAPLGAGGMGEVYRARDTRLGREVAVKVLPAEFSQQSERLRRFEGEARAASALSDPHIVTVFDIGVADGIHFFASELIEGSDLRHLLQGGALPIKKALDFAEQIASGLATAHEKGIVHRDLKPENILITKSGLAKIADFGLAKLTESSAAKVSELPTSDGHQTSVGVVLGTVAYMSPEQVRGENLDYRSDIFSFGAVFYELLTGRKAFDRGTAAETMAAILKEEPPELSSSGRNIPAALEHIVEHCLEKNPAQRFHSLHDVVFAMQEARSQPSGVGRQPPPAPARGARLVGGLGRRMGLALAAVAPARKRIAKALWATLAAAVLLLAAVLGYLYRGRGQTIDSLAVLPMVNATADSSSEYVSDGITESLINSLSQLPSLKVMSRSSVFRYKGRETDPQAVGRELKVRAVLTSRLVHRGENVSISAELVDARDNSHIWGEQYNRKLADIQAVQEEIGREITDKLRVRLSGEQRKSLARRQTRNSKAYQDYLKGRYYWNKRTPAGLQTAIEHFNAAIARDPTFALAHAGLADSYVLLSAFVTVPARDCLPKARAEALKALEIDETLGEAYAALGRAKVAFDLDWAGAERDFKRAIQLNPGYATAHQWYGMHLAAMHRFDEAILEIKKAQELDPVSAVMSTFTGWVLFQARRYDQAIDQLRQAIAMDPSFPFAHGFLGSVYGVKGMYPEAIDELRTALRLSEGHFVFMVCLGYTYAVSGNQVEAQKILAEMLARSQKGYFPAFGIGTVYAGLGDKDRAFEWLGKAVEERGGYLAWLPTSPLYDPLRSDLRFPDLLRRLNLAP